MCIHGISIEPVILTHLKSTSTLFNHTNHTSNLLKRLVSQSQDTSNSEECRIITLDLQRVFHARIDALTALSTWHCLQSVNPSHCLSPRLSCIRSPASPIHKCLNIHKEMVYGHWIPTSGGNLPTDATLHGIHGGVP
jgi:hypothetical protein